MALTCLMYVALSSSWGCFAAARATLAGDLGVLGIGAYTSALALEKFRVGQSIALGAGLAAVAWPWSWARPCCTCAAPTLRC